MLSHRYRFQARAPRMVGDYKGKRVHSTVRHVLSSTWFADSNARMCDLLGKQLGWGVPDLEAQAVMGAVHKPVD